MRALSPGVREDKQVKATTEYALLIVLIGLLVIGAIRLWVPPHPAQMKKTGDTVSGSALQWRRKRRQ